MQGRIVDLDKDVGENYEVGRKSDVPSFPQFLHFPGSSPYLIIYPSKLCWGYAFHATSTFFTPQVVDLTGKKQSGFPHIRTIGYSEAKEIVEELGETKVAGIKTRVEKKIGGAWLDH